MVVMTKKQKAEGSSVWAIIVTEALFNYKDRVPNKKISKLVSTIIRLGV